MEDDSFEDSFESSSDIDSETQQDIVPAYTEREDLSYSYPSHAKDFLAPLGVKSSQSRLHSQSSPLDVDSSITAVHQQHGLVSKLYLQKKRTE